MSQPLTYFSLAGRLFAAPAGQIRGLRRWTASTQAEPDHVEIDLRSWLGQPQQQAGKVIEVQVDAREVALHVDSIVDLQTTSSTILPLPELLHAAGFDPAVTGVLILEETLVVVLDLETLARRLTQPSTIEIHNGGL